jgi:lipoprotein-anchoring transpeptidase ErfK/SrfK
MVSHIPQKLTHETARVAGILLLVIICCGFAAAQDAQPQVPALTRRILVSIPDRKLAVLENGIVVATFPVSVGAMGSPSPTGEFRVVRRLTNPAYYHPGVIVPAGNNNPLGPRWVGLDRPHYGIHGTNEPRSIGKAASHGCIRMKNRDIQRFFDMVKVGDTVEIRGERDAEISQIFGGPSASDNNTLAQTGMRETPAMGGGH